jgi:hypothetical protein
MNALDAQFANMLPMTRRLTNLTRLYVLFTGATWVITLFEAIYLWSQPGWLYEQILMIMVVAWIGSLASALAGLVLFIAAFSKTSEPSTLLSWSWVASLFLVLFQWVVCILA